MDLKDIKAIIDLMKKNSISEFELERQDFKIRLRRGPNGGNPPIQYEDSPNAQSSLTTVSSLSIKDIALALVGVGEPALIRYPMTIQKSYDKRHFLI